MADHQLDQDTADRLLEGALEPVPDGARPLVEVLDELRLLRSVASDPAAERDTIRAMAWAVGQRRHRRWRLGRPVRLAPAGIRAAAVLAAVMGLVTAGAAIAGTSPGSAASTVLAPLGLDPEDARDREADLRDLAEDQTERDAERGRPPAEQAKEGRAIAAGKRGAARRGADDPRRRPEGVSGNRTGPPTPSAASPERAPR